MKTYSFGYLFVRLNKLLSGLALLGGVLLSLFNYTQGKFEADSARYMENDALPRQLLNLQAVLAQTQSIVLSASHEAVLPSQFSAANESPEFAQHYETLAQFEALHAQLVRAAAAGDNMKRYLTDRFDNSVVAIRNKLLAYAKNVSASANVNTATAAAVDSATPQTTNRLTQLFAAELSRTDVIDRHETLENAKQIFGVIENVSENIENRNMLRTSILELDKFAALLPQAIEVAKEPSDDQTSTSSSPRKVLTSEKVASQLASLQSQVDMAITSSWSFDRSYDKALQVFSEESQKCRIAALQIRRIWLATITSIIKTMVAAVCASAAFVVLADLTKAVLDTARNTGVVGDAYRSAGHGEQ